MSRKLFGIGLCAVLLLVAGIGLLRSTASDVPMGPTHRASSGIPATPSSAAPRPHTIEISRTRDSAPTVSESEPASQAYSKLVKDPQGARNVLDIFGMDMDSPAAKLQAIRTAIIDTGSCADSICTKTKESLLARIDAAAAQARRPLTTKSLRCYHVACIADVTAPPGVPLQFLMDGLQQSGKFDWPAPTMFSSPTIEKDRTQSAVWVLFNPAAAGAH